MKIVFAVSSRSSRNSRSSRSNRSKEWPAQNVTESGVTKTERNFMMEKGKLFFSVEVNAVQSNNSSQFSGHAHVLSAVFYGNGSAEIA